MIVLGADAHKRSHTIAAVAAATGEVLGEKTVAVGARGFGALLIWARGLDRERVWALEDCRHVAGSLGAVLDRARRARGSRLDPVDGRLAALKPASAASPTASTRSRSPAPRCARDSRRCRPRSWPGPSSICGCWSITASGWFASAWRSTARCSGICTISGPSSSCPAARCSRPSGAPGSAGASRAPSRRCASGSPATSCAACANSPSRSARSKPRSPQLVGRLAPQLVAEPGCGPLTAAKLVGEIAGADRFATDAKLARAAGIAPIPVSSGKTNRHRLDRGGNRQINAAIHRIAITRARCHPETRDYIARKQRRRQDHPRRHPLPQAPPRPPHLAPPATARAHPGPDDHTHFFDIGAAEPTSAHGRAVGSAVRGMRCSLQA